VFELLDPDTELERTPEALWRNRLDGVLILAPDADQPIHITQPGDMAWELLAEPVTTRQIVERIAAHFGVAAATASSDIEAAMLDLLKAGAIRRTDGAPPHSLA
jgi:hypothetical protein